MAWVYPQVSGQRPVPGAGMGMGGGTSLPAGTALLWDGRRVIALEGRQSGWVTSAWARKGTVEVGDECSGSNRHAQGG